MSVINQLLLDLEKRRALGPERGVLPDHVRVLPPTAGHRPIAQLAAFAGLALAAAAAWALWQGGGLTSFRGRAAGSEVATVPLAARSAKSVNVTPPSTREAVRPAPRESRPAARLSFELSRAPQPAVEPVKVPISAASLLDAPSSRAAPAVASEPARATQPARTPANAPQASTPRAPVELHATRGEIDKQVRTPGPREQAEAAFREGSAFVAAGRPDAARQAFERALARFPGHHAARQALLGVLVQAGRLQEAERVMQEGLTLAPERIDFAMALARLEMERDDIAAAISTLEHSLPHAASSAEYRGFLGGLLQRQQRHREAIEQFRAALRLKPGVGVWQLALGISLQALDRNAEARSAYEQARASASLSAELKAVVAARLAMLN